MLKNFIQEHFFAIHVTLGFVLVYFLFSKFNDRDSKTQFQKRESERNLKFKKGVDSILTQQAKQSKSPFLLTGIRIDGQAHEILGIRAQASVAEIQKAHRELMKKYHPDVIASQDTQAWKDAQLIAEKLNEAKAQMLEKAKKKKLI